MVYIPYPRKDLDTHANLVRWRAQGNKNDGDWKELKDYLADSARLVADKHPITKCWYSEIPQGDDFARDVEHFRPKNTAEPLNNKQIKTIEKLAGIKYLQDAVSGNYIWLKFDYRNYRIVSAKTNRGGAKHIYFPIAPNTFRLAAGELPWLKEEFPYCLDPTNKHDASLLFVKPNGEIAPIINQTQLSQTDIDNLPASWQNDGFNYLRAVVSIVLYRLNDPVFIKGRKEIYDSIIFQLNSLALLITEKINSAIIDRYIINITDAALPSAPFSLAAKCALTAYVPPIGTDPNVSSTISTITKQILNKIQGQIDQLEVDWTKP
jgi:hypothetical protein